MLNRSHITRSLATAIVIASVGLMPTTSTASTSMAAPPATAAIQAICLLQNDFFTFTPGLPLVDPVGNQNYTFKGTKIDRGNCTTPANEYSELVSGNPSSGSGSNLSCTGPNPGVTGSLRLKWTLRNGNAVPNPSTSTLTIATFAISSVTKVVTFTGTVTAGRFSGNPFTIVYASTANTALCGTLPGDLGLVGLPGPATVTIGSV